MGIGDANKACLAHSWRHIHHCCCLGRPYFVEWSSKNKKIWEMILQPAKTDVLRGLALTTVQKKLLIAAGGCQNRKWQSPYLLPAVPGSACLPPSCGCHWRSGFQRYSIRKTRKTRKTTPMSEHLQERFFVSYIEINLVNQLASRYGEGQYVFSVV